MREKDEDEMRPDVSHIYKYASMSKTQFKIEKWNEIFFGEYKVWSTKHLSQEVISFFFGLN